MKSLYSLFLGILCSIPTFLLAQKQPNIIIFMVDDMGWQDTSYPFHTSKTTFNTLYETPNMERLAKMGVAFTNFYATPVCTPSRVSMITGMNASRHGVTNWTATMRDKPTGQQDAVMNETKWNHNGLSPVEGVNNTVVATPLPQILKDNGYFTIHTGKAHWGAAGTPGSNPYTLGFVVNIAGTSTGRPASYFGTQNFGRTTADYHGVENLQAYFGQNIYLTEALTKETIQTLDYPLAQKIPFFLHLGQYAIHDPLMEDTRFYQKYLDKGMPVNEAKYASMIEGMDKSLGDILDYLTAKKALDNTIIIFVSDNGGLSAHSRAGEAHTHNKPLRSGKGSIYEGGIRVPLIIKGVKGSQQNIRIDEPVIIEDLFPTILAFSKVKKYGVKQTVDGLSIEKALTKGDLNLGNRPLIFHIPNKWTTTDGDGFNYRSAIRKGNYKLIHHIKYDNYSLYDLSKDIGEQHDLSHDSTLQSVKESLQKELNTILMQNKAPMPSKK